MMLWNAATVLCTAALLIPGLTPIERQRNRRDAGALGSDRHRLPAATGRKRQVGRESVAPCGCLDVIAGGASGKRPGSVAAGFGPRTPDRAAMVFNIACEIEIIARAGTS